jgi:hypothetical protein
MEFTLEKFLGYNAESSKIKQNLRFHTYKTKSTGMLNDLNSRIGSRSWSTLSQNYAQGKDILLSMKSIFTFYQFILASATCKDMLNNG